MDPYKIGRFIYQLRKERNLSQYQLAELIPISRQGVSKWERGINTPDTQTLIQLSEMFDVSINELLNGERQTKTTLEETTLSILDQSNKKTKTIKRITTTSIIIIVVLLLLFLSYYFINSYNKIEVYKIGNTNSKFNITDGIYITTSEKYYLKLGKITNKIDAEIKSIKLYYKKGNKKITLIKDNNIDNITIIESYGYKEKLSKLDIDYLKDNLYLEIIYNENEKETIKLRYKRDYKNSSLFFLNQKQVDTNPIPKTDTQPVIEEVKEEPPIIENEVIEEKPQVENKTEEKSIPENIEEKVEESVITTEQIISKIKETCTLDIDSYICEYSEILIIYSESENQIMILNGDDIVDDYQISLGQHICTKENCEEEFNEIIKENLF